MQPVEAQRQDLALSMILLLEIWTFSMHLGAEREAVQALWRRVVFTAFHASVNAAKAFACLFWTCTTCMR